MQNENGELVYYDIYIDDVNHNSDKNKNLVISIVDDDLIALTGGIIRGMSGTPIIQNDKIVGAITYVFRDNPQKGYGIFIEEMIKLDK
jgi:stage IV sporulation protein B